LGALNRRGAGIDWYYTFAGYDGATDVYHVYITVIDSNGDQIWIDPVPGAGEMPTIVKKRRV
jgi:hypothetical protein